MKEKVVYAGKTLKARQACFWKVRIWDHAGQPSAWSQPAWWSMGLLNSADWSARWISDPTLADPASRERQLMGGSWFRPARYLQCGASGHADTGLRHPDIGFRVVREAAGTANDHRQPRRVVGRRSYRSIPRVVGRRSWRPAFRGARPPGRRPGPRARTSRRSAIVSRT